MKVLTCLIYEENIQISEEKCFISKKHEIYKRLATMALIPMSMNERKWQRSHETDLRESILAAIVFSSRKGWERKSPFTPLLAVWTDTGTLANNLSV